MTKLEELIKELCPNGVEYKKLGDVCAVLTGGEPPEDYIRSQEPQDEYIYPIYSNGIGDNALWGYSKTFRVRCRAVTFSSIGTIGNPILREKCFTPIIRLKVIIPLNESILLTEYLKYILEIAEFKQQKSSVANVNSKMISSIIIPLPPLAVQYEIVRILDDFTEEVKALQCKLQEELDARRKQYEYYRGKLLSFDKLNSEYKVRWLRIGDVCAVSAGGDISKDCVSSKQSSEYSVPIISNGIGANAIYGYTSNAKITEPAVTVAARGTIGYAEYRDYPYYPIIRLLSCISLDTNKLNTKYLYYCLQGKQYPVPTGGIPQLIAPELKKVQIPVPPLEVQEKIVETLDKFDKLCNDLSEGLPAEIEARKKQYEYYRDKLLSFKEYV